MKKVMIAVSLFLLLGLGACSKTENNYKTKKDVLDLLQKEGVINLDKIEDKRNFQADYNEKNNSWTVRLYPPFPSTAPITVYLISAKDGKIISKSQMFNPGPA